MTETPDAPKTDLLQMDFAVFPTSGPGGYVAVLLDLVAMIWPSADGRSTFLSQSYDPTECVEVNIPFLEMMDWFDHFIIEPAEETEDGNDGDIRRSGDAGGSASGLRLVQVEIEGQADPKQVG